MKPFIEPQRFGCWYLVVLCLCLFPIYNADSMQDGLLLKAFIDISDVDLERLLALDEVDSRARFVYVHHVNDAPMRNNYSDNVQAIVLSALIQCESHFGIELEPYKVICTSVSNSTDSSKFCRENVYNDAVYITFGSSPPTVHYPVFDVQTVEDMVLQILHMLNDALILLKPNSIYKPSFKFQADEVISNAQKFTDKAGFFLCFGDESTSFDLIFCAPTIYNLFYRSFRLNSENISAMLVSDKHLLGHISQHLTNTGAVDKEWYFNESYALWYVDCKEVHGNMKDCSMHRYYGSPTSLNAFDFAYLASSYPPMSMVSDVADISEFITYDYNVGFIVCYQLSCEQTDAIRTFSNALALKLRGMLPIALVSKHSMSKELSALLDLGISEKATSPFSIKLWLWDRLSKQHKLVPVREPTQAGEQLTLDVVVQHCLLLLDVRHSWKLLESVDSHIAFVNRLINSTTRSLNRMSSSKPSVHEQDDEVELLLEVFRDPDCWFCPLSSNNVTILRDCTTIPFIKNHTTAFVLFHLNDATSRAAFVVYRAAADALSGFAVQPNTTVPFGAVACHDWPDVCNRHGVTTWPRLLVFQNGDTKQPYSEYKGAWEAGLLVDTFMLYESPSVVPLQTIEVAKDLTAKGILPTSVWRMPRSLSAVTVLLFDKVEGRVQDKCYQAFLDTARQLHGRFVFAEASGDAASSLLKDELLIFTYKFGENSQISKQQFKGICDVESLTDFVVKSSYPLYFELTAITFPAMFQRRLPFVLLIDNTIGETDKSSGLQRISDSLRQLSMDSEFTNRFSFGYMKNSSTVNVTDLFIGLKLEVSDLPALACINSKAGKVYMVKYDKFHQWSKLDVKEWLESIEAGMLSSSAELMRYDSTNRPLYQDYMLQIHGVESVGYTEYNQMRPHKKAGNMMHEGGIHGTVEGLHNDSESPMHNVRDEL